MKKEDRLIAIKCLVVLLILFLGIILLLGFSHPLLKLGFSHPADEASPIGEIADQKIIQTFKGADNGLSKIALKFATFKRENSGRIIVRLIDKDREILLGEQAFGPLEILDNQYLDFKFDSVRDSKNKSFSIEITAEDSSQGNAFTVWRTDKDIHKDGKLFYDDQYQTGDLQMITKYKMKDGFLEIIIDSIAQKAEGDKNFFALYFISLLISVFFIFYPLFLYENEKKVKNKKNN